MITWDFSNILNSTTDRLKFSLKITNESLQGGYGEKMINPLQEPEWWKLNLSPKENEERIKKKVDKMERYYKSLIKS